MPPNSIPPLERQEGVPRAGDILAEKYRVERVLGGGGMGMVCAAMHLDLEERVALKFLLPSVLSEETVARFSREAKAAARIKSAHVARVTDIGCLDTGSPYMVMEYLEGKNLKELVTERGPLPVKESVEYLLQAIEALAEAHALGIVHRDLKPANMFLADRGGAAPIVKLIDFGISKVLPRGQSLPDDDPSMTQTSAWLGSPLYMSPEQLRSARDVDMRTDIWGLGVTLFELLTGRVPFDHTSFPDLCAMILHEPAPRLETYLPSAPPGLGDLVARCLEKDVDRRTPSVGELALALVHYGPQRARSVAERAVSISEAAGLLVRPAAGRHPLDGTLPEEMMSPLADRGASRPAPPLESIPPPALGQAPLAVPSTTTGGVSMSGPQIPRAPRVPNISSAPPHDFSDIEPPSNPVKIVGVVAALTVALGVVLYMTGVIHVDRPVPVSATEAQEGEGETSRGATETSAPATAEPDEEDAAEAPATSGSAASELAPSAPTASAITAPSKPPGLTGAPHAGSVAGGVSTGAAQSVSESSPATATGETAAPDEAPPPPPPPKVLDEKCYTDGPDGTKIEKPCAW
jgi:serine/threonine protein kinase